MITSTVGTGLRVHESLAQTMPGFSISSQGDDSEWAPPCISSRNGACCWSVGLCTKCVEALGFGKSLGFHSYYALWFKNICGRFSRFMSPLFLTCRMEAPGLKDVKVYVARARASIVIDTAARAWALGVPWAEALKMSKTAMAKATNVLPPALKRKGKGKGKGRWDLWPESENRFSRRCKRFDKGCMVGSLSSIISNPSLETPKIFSNNIKGAQEKWSK